MPQAARKEVAKRCEVRTRSGSGTLEGELTLPEHAEEVVLFVHDSGSSSHSPRNQFAAEIIRGAGIGTLLFDLLTTEEERIDRYTRHLRFKIEFLAERLVDATYWLKGEIECLHVGYFGAGIGAAAALVAAAELGEVVGAVVSRGGRPDLARGCLPFVKAPTLLIVGELDSEAIELNRHALSLLRCEKEVEIVAGAHHLGDEPAAMDQVAHLAAQWFEAHLASRTRSE